MDRNSDRSLEQDIELIDEIADLISVGCIDEARRSLQDWRYKLESQLEDIKE